jgi:hypothetical protein
MLGSVHRDMMGESGLRQTAAGDGRRYWYREWEMHMAVFGIGALAHTPKRLERYIEDWYGMRARRIQTIGLRCWQRACGGCQWPMTGLRHDAQYLPDQPVVLKSLKVASKRGEAKDSQALMCSYGMVETR